MNKEDFCVGSKRHEIQENRKECDWYGYGGVIWKARPGYGRALKLGFGAGL